MQRRASPVDTTITQQPENSPAPGEQLRAILSPTVGIPRILVPPPCGFGISTARTGGGKYVPDDIRFQIRYKLFFRSVSNSSMDCPSTPDTAWPVNGHPPDSSRGFAHTPVLMPSPVFRRFINGSLTLAFLIPA